MTDLERLELQRSTVERIKQGAAIARANAGRWKPTSRSRVAARYAYLCRCSLADAASVFDLCRSSVRDAWRIMFPGVTALVSRRVA